MKNQKQNIAGFTLMELIGVMAILAILAAILAPNFFKTINDAYAVAEKENLEQLGEELEHYILTNKAIPSQSSGSWTAALSSVSEYPEADILDNRRGFQRALFVDPRFFSSADTSFGGYTQTSGASSAPNSARIMLLSDMTADIPSLSSTTAVFDAIWDQTGSAAVVEGPDVKIHRLNISDLFNRVILSNANSSQTAYSLEGGSQNPIPAASGGTDGSLEFWVIDGTEVRLYGAPYPSGSLTTVSLVDSSFSYAFEKASASSSGGSSSSGDSGSSSGDSSSNNGVGGGSGGGSSNNRGRGDGDEDD